MMYGLPSISLVFMSFFPSALQLYFVATGAFAFCQSRLLASKAFRTRMNMAIAKNSKNTGVEELEVAQHSKGLQLLQQRLAQEKAQASNPAKTETETGEKEISAIDGWVNSFKGYKEQVGQQVTDGLREFQGKTPSTNADGSTAPAPRLSESARKRAEEYERVQREQDAAERDQRNLERQQAHQRYLEQQKEKAKKGLDRQIKQAAAKKSKRNTRGRRP
jgi:YidC/Oxa1 family membrane protein insertase